MQLPTFHLPGLGAPRVDPVRFGERELGVARLEAEQLRAVIEHAIASADRVLRKQSTVAILARLDRIVARWLEPGYALRRDACSVLPAVTGYSPAMVAHGLPLHFELLGSGDVAGLIERELGHVTALDESGVRLPALIVHVLSGNIPGLCIAPVLLTLALKSAVLLKGAAGDPLLPALFARSIAEIDPELGECIAVAHWRGGDLALEQVAFESADMVVASGSTAAIAAIRERVAGRFIGHGHKVSFAVIGREALATEVSAGAVSDRLAYDVSLWDQQGCLSPQIAYVESGSAVPVERFAEMLAEALERWAADLPPRRLDLHERAAVQRFRDETEWRGGTLFASLASTAWSIALQEHTALEPTCLNRCLRLARIDDLSLLPASIAPHRELLEAAGVALAPERREPIASLLLGSGVHRVCALGEMQRPTLAWRQGGRPRIAEWLP